MTWLSSLALEISHVGHLTWLPSKHSCCGSWVMGQVLQDWPRTCAPCLPRQLHTYHQELQVLPPLEDEGKLLQSTTLSLQCMEVKALRDSLRDAKSMSSTKTLASSRLDPGRQDIHRYPLLDLCRGILEAAFGIYRGPSTLHAASTIFTEQLKRNLFRSSSSVAQGLRLRCPGRPPDNRGQQDISMVTSYTYQAQPRTEPHLVTPGG